MGCCKLFLAVFLGFLSINLIAQKHDYHWITGYGSNVGNPDFGLSILQFEDFGKVDTFSKKDSSFDMDFFKRNKRKNNESYVEYIWLDLI